jgi:hypothetical protein
MPPRHALITTLTPGPKHSSKTAKINVRLIISRSETFHTGTFGYPFPEQVNITRRHKRKHAHSNYFQDNGQELLDKSSIAPRPANRKILTTTNDKQPASAFIVR